MNELLREIQEDMRAERLRKFGSEFGKTMVRVSIAILVGTIGAVIWQNYQESQATEKTAKIMQGVERLNAGDQAGAISIFDEVDDLGSVYGRMAAMQKARALSASGDKEAAAKTYEAVAAKSSDDVFATMARLLLAEDGTKKLNEPSKDSPLYHIELEMYAWQLMEEGKKEEAATKFAALRDDSKAPFSQRARVSEVLAYLSPNVTPVKAELDE